MANPELTHQPSSMDHLGRAAARALSPTSPQRRSAARKLSRGLGWFSIGLGVVELLAARPLARFTGLQGHETLLKAYGLREITTGIGLLSARSPEAAVPWVRGRVAGDALDLATLGGALVRAQPPGSHPGVAVAAVAGVAMLDVACARALGQEAHAARQTTDYSDRAGLPSSPEEMRGAALETFKQPPDMRASAASAGAGSRVMHR